MALVALAAPALIGASALAVDLGSLYLAERRLQGVADAAAAAAVMGADSGDARAAADAAIIANGVSRVEVLALEQGAYTRDAEIEIDQRFKPGTTDANAVRVDLVQDVPLFFGVLFSDGGSTQVRAQAVAARQDVIAFDIGTKLVAASGGLAGRVLSGLAGRALDLDSEAFAAIAAARIDVIDFADQLRRLQDEPESTFGAAFDRSTDLPVAIRAMAAAIGDAQAREALLALSYQLEATPVVVSDIIELGPFRGSDVNDGRTTAVVDAYSLLRNLFEASHPEGYDFTIAASAAGLTGVNVRVAAGRGYERSPWLTLTAAYEIVLRTAATRVGIDAQLATPAGTVRLPLYTELAAGEARLASVDCSPRRVDETAELGVTASLGNIALADIASGSFADFSTELGFKPARIVDTLLLKVDADGELALGGSTEQFAHFTRADIDQGRRKIVGTNDLAQTAVASLVEDVHISASVAGIGLGLGGGASNVPGVIGTALSSAAPAVDGLMAQLTNSLGVMLGAAEVGVITLKCGRATVVA